VRACEETQAVAGRSGASPWTALAAGVAAFLLYAALLPQSVGWLDAPELLAAGSNLAQPHPPGHPAFVAALKAFLLLPAGDAAFRGNLFSAVLGAVAAALTAAIAGVLATSAAGDRAPRWTIEAAALSAGLGLAACGSAAIQSLSLEVYTLNAALSLGALLLAILRPGDARAAVPVAAMLGLGLANHHLLTVLAMPGLAVAWLRRGCLRGVAIGAAAAILVAAGTYAFLAARSAAGAWPAWADASSLDGLLWVASARVFAGSVGGFGEGGIAANAASAPALVAQVLSPLAPALAAWACVALWRRGGGRPAAAVALLVAGSLASKVMMGILDPDNPDDHGYFLAAMAGTTALAAAGAAALVGAAARLRPGAARAAIGAGGVACLAGTAVFPAAAGAPVLEERSHEPDTAAVGRVAFGDAPVRSALLLSHYPVFFLATERGAVEGARPDVTVVQQGFNRRARGGGAYAARVASDDPDLAGLAGAFVSTGALDWGEVVRLAGRRPVGVEADPDLRAPLGDLRFAGWTWEVAPGAPPDPAGAAARARAHVDALRRAAPAWPRPGTETRRVLLRNLAASATWLSGRGEGEAASVLLAAAAELAPNDATVRAMRTGAVLAPPKP